MKKVFTLTALLLFTGFAIGQIRVTPEGYPLLPKKPSETTMTDNDSIPMTKADGILRAISLGDFKSLLPAGGGGGTYTAGEGLNLNTDEFSVDSTKVILLDANSPELGIVQIAIGTNAQLDALPAPVGYKRLSFSTDGDGLTPINSGDYLSKPEYDADEDLLVDGVDSLTVGSPQIIDGSIQNQDIQSGTINLDKLVSFSEATFVGRMAGAGLGSLQQITSSSAKSILNYAADEVSAVDAGGYFSGGELEAITQELGASLNIIDSDGDGLVSGVENGVIGTTKISNNAITNSKMADASINTSEVVDQAITKNKINVGFYQHGNFTPTFSDAGGGATYTTNSVSGTFTRIGEAVIIEVSANIVSTTGTPTGEFRIGNLPSPNGSGTSYTGQGSVFLAGIYMVGINSASATEILSDNLSVSVDGSGYAVINRDYADAGNMAPMPEVGFVDGQIKFTLICNY